MGEEELTGAETVSDGDQKGDDTEESPTPARTHTRSASVMGAQTRGQGLGRGRGHRDIADAAD